jgi:hypothetical protein
LTADGGSIDVSVNNPSDPESRMQVRVHLQQIAGEFSKGNFAKPFATHGRVVPGTRTMRKRHAAIAYTYEDTADGGRVRISASDGEATVAVHAFLRYQIRKHATGDPPTVRR